MKMIADLKSRVYEKKKKETLFDDRFREGTALPGLQFERQRG